MLYTYDALEAPSREAERNVPTLYVCFPGGGSEGTVDIKLRGEDRERFLAQIKPAVDNA